MSLIIKAKYHVYFKNLKAKKKRRRNERLETTNMRTINLGFLSSICFAWNPINKNKEKDSVIVHILLDS